MFRLMSATITSKQGQGKPTDARSVAAELYLLPVSTRMPLKFGAATVTEATCARVKLGVRGRYGRVAEGWGETPLSADWAWPGGLSYCERLEAMVAFCERLAAAWASAESWGHPPGVGVFFHEEGWPG